MVVWSPFKFNCGQEVANRFVIAPLTTDASHDDGTATEHELKFVRRRAANGFGAAISSATYVEQDGRSWLGIGATMTDTCPVFGGWPRRCVSREVSRSSRYMMAAASQGLT